MRREKESERAYTYADTHTCDVSGTEKEIKTVALPFC